MKQTLSFLVTVDISSIPVGSVIPDAQIEQYATHSIALGLGNQDNLNLQIDAFKIERVSAHPSTPQPVPGSKMEAEFPHFPPLEAEIGDLLAKYGFSKESSWHNDACPSFATPGHRWQLWICHPNPASREVAMERFALTMNDEDGCIITDQPPVFSVETVEELAEGLKKWKSELEVVLHTSFSVKSWNGYAQAKDLLEDLLSYSFIAHDERLFSLRQVWDSTEVSQQDTGKIVVAEIAIRATGCDTAKAMLTELVSHAFCSGENAVIKLLEMTELVAE